MKILIIDDSEERHETFKKFFKCHVDSALNFDEFMELIKRNEKYNVIFFDHDLGFGPNGVDVARWLISEHADKIPNLCVVHSNNPIGGMNICNELLKTKTQAVWESFSISSVQSWANRLELNKVEKKGNNMSVLKTPVGGNRRFLVKMNGNPFASFDTDKQANDYIKMQKEKKKGNNRDSAFAANQNWSVEDRK